MKLASFLQDSRERVGVVIAERAGIVPLGDIGFPFPSMQRLIEQAAPSLLSDIAARAAVPDTPMLSFDAVTLLSPLPVPRRDNICIGFNFQSHAQEITKQRGESAAQATINHPIYFTKRVFRATGDGGVIPYLPGLADALDCGVEVAVVIGRDMLNVSQRDVMDYVFGYMVCNDVCDTRLNKVYTQPFLGKSVDGYMPFGPFLTTADEFSPDEVFHLRLSVNGQVIQDSTTDHLVFPIRYILSELSQDMTLKAGTIISTGSPANSESWQQSGGYKPGDVVVCEVDGLGTLTNTVTQISRKEGASA